MAYIYVYVHACICTYICISTYVVVLCLCCLQCHYRINYNMMPRGRDVTFHFATPWTLWIISSGVQLSSRSISTSSNIWMPARVLGDPLCFHSSEAPDRELRKRWRSAVRERFTPVTIYLPTFGKLIGIT